MNKIYCQVVIVDNLPRTFMWIKGMRVKTLTLYHSQSSIIYIYNLDYSLKMKYISYLGVHYTEDKHNIYVAGL